MNWILLPMVVCGTIARIIDLEPDSNLTYVNANRFTKITPADDDYLKEYCGTQEFEEEGEPYNKINGGQRAMEGQFPWTVTIWRANKNQTEQPDKGKFIAICTGTLISDRHVLSAAHCFYNFTSRRMKLLPETIIYDVRVTAGGTCNFERDACEGDRFKKEKFTYDIKAKVIAVPRVIFSTRSANDVAILELEEPIIFNARVSHVCLPGINATYPSNSTIYQMGFGFDESWQESADLRFLISEFSGTSDKNDTTHVIKAGVPLNNEPNNFFRLNQTNNGDSGSGLIYYNEEDTRFYSIGVLSRGTNVDKYTDLRYFVELICASTGVCYMTKFKEVVTREPIDYGSEEQNILSFAK